ncbi:MAG TPA: STAS domain-containing protein [Phycisphaerae bacterium]|nr:STAS domain-containing protein [Phycisphaerae bacterium]
MSAGPDKEFKIDVEETGSTAVVRIRGSAGMTQAEPMRRQLEQLAARQVSLIVLDLSQMEFISSLGLGAIITGYLKSRHHNGRIRLVNPRPAVRKLLEMTRLTKLFPIYPTVEQALCS